MSSLINPESSGSWNMGSLRDALPKQKPTPPPLPPRNPSSRSTKGIPAKKLADEQELLKKLSSKPKTRSVVDDMLRNPGKYKKKVDEALDLIKKHEVERSDDELLEMLGKMKLGGRRKTLRKKHKHHKKTKRSSY